MRGCEVVSSPFAYLFLHLALLLSPCFASRYRAPYDHIIAVSIDNTQSNVTPQIYYSHVNYVRRPHHRSKNRLRGVYPSWTQTSPITSHSLRVLISRPSGLSAS